MTMGSSLPAFVTIFLSVTFRTVSGFAVSFADRTLPAVPPSARRPAISGIDPTGTFTASSLKHHPCRPSISHMSLNGNANNHKNDSIDAKDQAYREAVLGESERRGNILFAASLVLVLWSFSLPLDLRRTHWCFIDSCVQDRASCYDCLTFEEWCQQVLEFYQTTPASEWVSFDFTSVDPKFVWSIERLSSGG